MIKLIFQILFICVSLFIVIGFFKQEWRAVVSAYKESVKRHVLEGIIGYWIMAIAMVIIYKHFIISILPLIVILAVSYLKELWDIQQGFGFEFDDVKERLIGGLYGLVIWGIGWQLYQWIRVL